MIVMMTCGIEGEVHSKINTRHTLVFHDRQSHEDDGLSDIITTTNVVMVWRLYALSNRLIQGKKNRFW